MVAGSTRSKVQLQRSPKVENVCFPVLTTHGPNEHRLLSCCDVEIVYSHFSSYHVSVKHRPQSTKVDPKKWKEPSACNLEKEKVKASANDSEKTVAKMAISFHTLSSLLKSVSCAAQHFATRSLCTSHVRQGNLEA